jgi:kynurenine formamidase
MALPAEWAELAESVRNWGRWGDDDERGTANLIDDAARRRGLAAVGAGRHLSMAIPLDQRSPQQGGAPGRLAPLRTMLSINQTYTGADGDAAFNDDTVVMAMSAGTHVDALGHCSYGGFLYNGFAADTVSAVDGLTRCGADKIGPLLSRGVLLDLPAARGVDRLEPGYAVTADDLDAAVELARVELVPGDVVCVRTGHMQRFHQGDTSGYNHDSPGLSTHTIRWIRDHDCGAVFTDTYVYEVWPPQDWAAMMVVHMIHLRDMGQVQGQNFDFEPLAAACADDGVYEFLFTGHPEPFTGAASAPVHPVATR